jgi:signal peptidase II
VIRVLPLATAVVVLDQVTKLAVLDRLAPGVSVDVTSWLALTLVMNTGLAFGLLANLPMTWRWIVALLSGLALALLARVAVRVLAEGGWPSLIAIGLIFGGAIGNLIDRARLGAVVDFVDVHWRGYHWWAFNVADASITVGVTLLAIHLLVRQPATVAADR